MKKSIVITFAGLFIVLSCCLSGCRDKSHEYDERLIAADEIVRHQPDSALLQLIAIDAKNLDGSWNRAYHALLLTQARYLCYVPVTNDSAISNAVAYYERHPSEVEKLTRAYLYKGTVLEELGDAEGAMMHYKRAMSQAASNDHFHQGYTRLRIGNIYRDNLVADSSDIAMFKEALHHFKQLPDSFYILTCMSCIGGSYIKHNRDSAQHYLELANVLASQLNEKKIECNNQIYIADLKMFGPDIQDVATAKHIALSLLGDKACPTDRKDHLLLTAAYTLARLDKADSASLYLNQVHQENLLPGLKVLRDKCLAEVARCKGDQDQFRHLLERSQQLADSLVTNDIQRQLRDTEARYNAEALKFKALKYRTNWIISMLATTLALCLLAIGVMVFTRKMARRQQQLQEQEDIIQQLLHDSSRLSMELDANQAMNEDLKRTIRNQIDVFTKLVVAYASAPDRSPEKFNDMFEKAYSLNKPDDSFWAGLRSFADSQFNGIISQTEENYPALNENDINFLCLCCCDLPTSAIMTCLGYMETHSVYNRKKRVLMKMGLPDCQLDDYIGRFKQRK